MPMPKKDTKALSFRLPSKAVDMIKAEKGLKRECEQAIIEAVKKWQSARIRQQISPVPLGTRS